MSYNNLPEKLLIVEDEAILRMYMKKILQKEGLQKIVETDRGDEAVRLALDHRPDVILMDIKLRGNLTGLDAAFSIFQVYHPRIIIMSAFNMDDYFKDGDSEKFSAVLSKPITKEILLSHITSV